MASGKIDKPANIALRSSSFIPTLVSGGSGFTGTNECYYYRYGPFVMVNYLFWNLKITSANAQSFMLSIPFTCYSARNYGLVGYDSKGILGNVALAAGGSNNGIGFFAPNSYSVLAGNQITSDITFQCSIIYITNDP